jgi:hypothetical protein
MGCPGVDCTTINPTYAYIWVKTDQDFNMFLTYVEDTTVLGSGVTEHWTSPQLFVAASPSWQLVEVSMASFIPNDYFHNTLGNPMDDNVFEAGVNSLDIQFGAALPSNTGPANVYFDNAGFATGSQGTPPAPTPTPVPGSVPYDNLEAPVMNGYSYNDGGGSTISYTQTSADANSGSKSYKFTVSNSAGVWGCGGGFNRSAGTYADATGMTKLRFYYKTANDPSNEQWVSSAQPLSTVGAWTMIEVPLTDFSTESIYNSQCTPNCTTTGDGVFNINRIFGIDFQFVSGTPVTNASIYIDDIMFVP